MTDPIDPNDQLRHRLQSGAEALDIGPEWNDFTVRLGRSYRRRVRLIGGAACFALLAGATSGYLAGRQSASDGDSVASAPGGADSTKRDAPEPTTPPPTTPAPGSDEGVWAAVDAVPAPVSPESYSPPTMTRLFVRDSAGGVAVRVYSQDYSYPTEFYPTEDTIGIAADGVPVTEPWPPADWQPAAWCNPVGDLVAEISTAEIATQSWFARFGEFAPGEIMMTNIQRVGEPEQAPVSVVIAQVTADITEVRVTFPDGTVDAMAPSDGVAALAAPVSWDLGADIMIDAVGADGAIVTSKSQGDTMYGSGMWDHPECQPPPPPPPTLPEAGEQPEDPEGAEAGVRTAIETVFNADGVERTEEEAAAYFEQKLALIDDTSGVEEAMNQLGETYPGITVTATVNDLVFTAPDRASVLFSLDTSLTDFDNRLGELVLVDGTWKVTRSTICDSLSLGGGYCDGEPTVLTIPAQATTAQIPTTAGG